MEPLLTAPDCSFLQSPSLQPRSAPWLHTITAVSDCTIYTCRNAVASYVIGVRDVKPWIISYSVLSKLRFMPRRSVCEDAILTRFWRVTYIVTSSPVVTIFNVKWRASRQNSAFCEQRGQFSNWYQFGQSWSDLFGVGPHGVSTHWYFSELYANHIHFQVVPLQINFLKITKRFGSGRKYWNYYIILWNVDCPYCVW